MPWSWGGIENTESVGLGEATEVKTSTEGGMVWSGIGGESPKEGMGKESEGPSEGTDVEGIPI